MVKEERPSGLRGAGKVGRGGATGEKTSTIMGGNHLVRGKKKVHGEGRLPR